MSSDDAEWFYAEDGEQKGPVLFPEFKEWWKKKFITEETFVWNEDMCPDGWCRIGDLPKLLQILPRLAAPPQSQSQPPVAKNEPSKAAAGSAAKRSAGAGAGSKTAAASSKPSTKPNVTKPNVPSNAGGWTEKRTVDGIPFYYNSQSGEVSWDKPDQLKPPEEKEADRGEWVWVPDQKEGYVPAAQLNKAANGDVEVRLQNGEYQTVKQSEKIFPMKFSSLQRLEDDLVMLDSMDEGLINYNLKERFRQDKIYTNIGTILVAINPFKMLPLYTPELITKYHQASLRQLEPHVFGLADSAHKQMLLNSINQSILISGESGAGKTESTKHCLAFLAEVAGSENDVEQRVLMANPVLEAFGNAKTLRNNNSSRFGKWIEVHFNLKGMISSATIESYLLEKSRVIKQQAGERNYHIFYQLLASDYKTTFGLGRPQDYHYLNQSNCFDVENKDDFEDWGEVSTAMNEMGFSDSETQWMLSIVAGCLNLGNVRFDSDGDQGSVVRDDQYLQGAARFLGVTLDQIKKALTWRSIEVRGQGRTFIPLNPEAASDGVDALTKAVYGAHFNWLIQRVNKSLEGSRGKFIGILDIFGFEIFERNTFEQLCINYANEKLQQHFNQHTFKLEEETYRSEGINFTHIEYIDNQPVLDLIEKRPSGILVVLDDEIVTPQGSDEGFMNKIDKLHRDNSLYVVDSKTRFNHKMSFTVVHYAGDVMYDGNGFYVKNKDTLYPDLHELMTNSSSSLTSALFPPIDPNSRKKYSLAGQFRTQLDNLMTLMHRTSPHYIRCVKPNDDKRSNMYVAPMVLDQLRYAGVFEAVRIRKSGYPFRHTHAQWVARYKCITRRNDAWVPLRNQDPKPLVSEILELTRQDFSDVQIGKRLVLYRAKEHRILELLRHLALEQIVPLCQRVARGALGRRFARKSRQARQILLDALSAGNNLPLVEQAMVDAAALIGPMRVLFDFEVREFTLVRELKRHLLEWVRLQSEMEGVVSKNPEQFYGEYSALIEQADALSQKVAPNAAQAQLLDRLRTALQSCAQARIDPEAEDALWNLDKERMNAVLAEAKQVGYTSSDLQEIEKLLAIPEQEFVKLQLKRAVQIKDPERVMNREIKLKEIYLNNHRSMFRFELYGKLRDPVDFASSKFFGNKEQLAAGMLRFTTKPLHISLTELEPRTSKEAIMAHKSIMGYMGDRRLAHPPVLAHNLVNKALQNPDLRAELYCQLMKQLTDNPNQGSRTKGWELFSLFVNSFRPGEDFENFVEIWLRENGPDRGEKLICDMRQLQYFGEPNAAPAAELIPGLVHDYMNQPLKARFSVV